MNYLFFDVDGTLNQTSLYALEAYKRALAKRNMVVAPEILTHCIGMTPQAIMKCLFGELEASAAEAWRADIKRLEYEQMNQCAAAFAGIKESLNQLKGLGYRLAICSNAYREHIDHVLRAIGLEAYFEVIGSLELGADKSEILASLLQKHAVSAACMIGDRKFDQVAARDNGLPFIGCAYGYAPDEVSAADVIVKHPQELPAAVTSLLSPV